MKMFRDLFVRSYAALVVWSGYTEGFLQQVAADTLWSDFPHL